MNRRYNRADFFRRWQSHNVMKAAFFGFGTAWVEISSFVFQCDVPHQWIANDMLALCLYTMTE